MRRVPVCRLRPGMTVGHDLHNLRGDILLHRGVTLTPGYIRDLLEIGVPALYIDDGLLPGLEIDDVIDERTRRDAVNQLKVIWGGTTDSGIMLEEEDADRLQVTVRGILDQLLVTLPVMANLTDIRSQDDYLFAHSVNVCVLSLLTGVSLGLDTAALLDLGMGALLHDIGKLLIPKDIMDKPGPLSDEEFALVKRHPEYSHAIVADREDCLGKTAALIALQHHERYNGRGYPSGLAGESIHDLAQIVGLTDIYDAMTADRVYRPAHRPDDVYEMLAASGGHYFDFRMVKAFLGNVAAYPRGCVVLLNSGETAVVVDTPPGYALYPKLKIILDSGGNCLGEAYGLELFKEIDRCIVKVLDDDEIEEIKRRVGAGRWVRT